jgi:Spy/CpxP family protein refolding chaperone
MTRIALIPISLLVAAGVARADNLPAAEVHNIAVQALERSVQLDAPTAERVQSVVDRYRDSILAARIDSTTTLQQLKLVLRDPHPDDRRVKKLNEALIAHRARLTKLREERVHDMSKVLTPPQFGRLLVSWRAIDRAIRKEARRS